MSRAQNLARAGIGLTGDTSGNVGIGTSSPQAKLDVNGVSSLRGTGTFGTWFDSVATNPYGSYQYMTFDLGSTQGAFRTFAKYDSSGAGSYNLGVATTGGSYGTNPSGLTYTNLLTLNSAGNLGLYATPNSWYSDYRSMQFGAYGGGVYGRVATNEVGLTQNMYRDAAAAFKFIANGYAASYTMLSGGGHAWFNGGNNASGAGAALTLTQAMTLDASGNLGLGVTPKAWNSTYRVEQIGDVSFLYGRTAGSTYETGLGSNWYRDSGGSYLYSNTGYATSFTQVSGGFAWYTAPSGTAGNAITFTQAMTLDANSRLLLKDGIAIGNVSYTDGIGIKFPAAQVASSDANTLDDYEEGTWTPQLITDSTGASITYTSQNGKYTKIGNVVYVEADIGWSARSGGSGNINVAGFPFGINDPSGLGVRIWITYNNNASAATVLGFYTTPNGTTALYLYPTSNNTPYASSAISGGGQMAFKGFYYV